MGECHSKASKLYRSGGRGGLTEQEKKELSEDKKIQEETNGVILSAKDRDITVTATKRNSKAPTTYSQQVVKATVDEDGNVVFDYPKGFYSGNYGDREQTVTYTLKAGAIDGQPFNLDLSRAKSVTGKGTYELKDTLKAAGMKWNDTARAWVSPNHFINTKTNYTKAELSGINGMQLDTVFRAARMKYLIKNRGMSLKEAEAKAKSGESKLTEEQKREAILQVNSI